MKKLKFLFFSVILFIILLFIFSYNTLAQNSNPKKNFEVPRLESQETLINDSFNESDKLLSLKRVLQSMERIKTEITLKQKQFKSPDFQGGMKELELELNDLFVELGNLKRSFEEIASGVNTSVFYSKDNKKQISFGGELEDLLSPVVNELKRATSRSREIDNLKVKLAESKEQNLISDNAIDNLEKLIKKTPKSAKVYQQIQESLMIWKDRQKNIKAQAGIAEQKLMQRLSKKKTIRESAQNVFELFFKSRGRNLLVALFMSVLFSISIRKLHGYVEKTKLSKDQKQKYNFRLLNFIFFLLSGIGGLLVFLLVLFAFGDWLLLTLGFLLIFGIIWTSKETLPHFWGQAALLLNMGSVREGERVIYKGVPFRVETLNFYSVLKNPLLDGAALRLPLKDLSALRSTELQNTEPWFPTKRGDWILLEDKKVAKVELQTSEFVKVSIPGGAKRNYFTEEFIRQNFSVISDGFRIKSIFGLDYKHKNEIVESIPNRLKEAILERFKARGYPESDYEIKVEFSEVAPSSLNISIICDFLGTWAKDYEIIGRLIPQVAVSISNLENWEIPFQQLTIHNKGQVVV